MAVGYSSSKLTLHVGDGFEFMKQNQDAFDVIITDSSDPMGKQGRDLGPRAATVQRPAFPLGPQLVCRAEDRGVQSESCTFPFLVAPLPTPDLAQQRREKMLLPKVTS